MAATDFGTPLAVFQELQDGQVYHIQLLRPNDREGRWEVVFDGDATLRVEPLRAFGRRPAGHVAISVESPEWADYTTWDNYDPATGVLLAEDYMMKLVPQQYQSEQQPEQRVDDSAAPEVSYAVEAEDWQYYVVKTTRQRVSSAVGYDEAYEMVRRLQEQNDKAEDIK